MQNLVPRNGRSDEFRTDCKYDFLAQCVPNKNYCAQVIPSNLEPDNGRPDEIKRKWLRLFNSMYPRKRFTSLTPSILNPGNGRTDEIKLTFGSAIDLLKLSYPSSSV